MEKSFRSRQQLIISQVNASHTVFMQGDSAMEFNLPYNHFRIPSYQIYFPPPLHHTVTSLVLFSSFRVYQWHSNHTPNMFPIFLFHHSKYPYINTSRSLSFTSPSSKSIIIASHCNTHITRVSLNPLLKTI